MSPFYEEFHAAAHVEAEEPRALASRRAAETLRVPPQSVEAEQAVLGGLMLVAEALDDVADILQPEMFYRRDHRLIYSAILAAKQKGRGFDAVVLGDWFEAKGLSEHVAGGAYLIELANTTPSAANIRAYAEIVADKALLRQYIEIGTGMVNSGFQPDGRESHELIAEAASRLSEIGLARASEGPRYVRTELSNAFDDIVARYRGESAPALVPPWSNVAAILPGLEDTDLMILAARPGMGKTAAALEFCDAAARAGRHVALFSLEMSRRQMTLRLISNRSGIDNGKLRRKDGLEDEDWTALTDAMRDLKELPIAIDDQAAMNIAALSARARRMDARLKADGEKRLGLIVVDYIQLMNGTGRGDKRHEELSEISRGLKLLAKELRCPVIGLSQLNRSLEARTDKRPTMADLRESGALEQDADVVAFLYRDDYYTKDQSNAPGITEFIVGKQRSGPTDTAYLRHELSCFRFYDHVGSKPYYGKAKSAPASNDGFDDVEIPRRRSVARGKDAASR
ncbi:replicative DNA helicase [Lysobacter soli]|uniref:replicative DNA helicase n=1 Tax=Lysobacter soli TaxID=453783 RepID=UPI0037C64B62